MKLTMEIPEMVAVVDTENYKGSPETVLSIAGIPVLYYKGHRHSEWPCTNEDWEDLVRMRLASALRSLLLDDETMAENWQAQPHGGRDVNFDPVINYVREDLD